VLAAEARSLSEIEVGKDTAGKGYKNIHELWQAEIG
jgi:hypothetical protein